MNIPQATLDKIPLEVLYELNKRIVATIREKQATKAREMRWKLSPGDTVQYTARGTPGWGVVKEIKIKRAVVEQTHPHRMLWILPIANLKPYQPNKPNCSDSSVPAF